MIDFGSNLQKIRTIKGFNQQDLADKLGLSQASISQFEKGSRQPTPAIVKKIADILEVPITELAGDEAPAELARQHLMRNLKGLSPSALKTINDMVELIKDRERAKRQGK